MGFRQFKHSVVVGKAARGLSEWPYDSQRTITQATKYYVSPTGSDSNDGLSTGAPFATLAHALTFAGPNKAVLLMNGTHTLTASVTPTVSGTAANPFLFSSAPGHTPVIDIGGDANKIEIDYLDYWHITNLAFTNYVIAFVVSRNGSSRNLLFQDLKGDTDIVVTGSPSGTGIIYFNGPPGTDNADTVIRRVKATHTAVGSHANAAGIYILRRSEYNLLIEDVELRGGPIGVVFKSDVAAPTLNNVTINNLVCLGQTRWSVGSNPAGVTFTNCLFGDGAAVVFPEDNGGAGGDNNTFNHCTFYDGVALAAQLGGAQDAQFNNCLFKTAFHVQTGSTVKTASNYNLFYPSIIERYGSSNTLAQWRTNNSSDANSVEGTPTFVGSDFTLIANYRLADGSTGENAGSDGQDMGCNVATVGVH